MGPVVPPHAAGSTPGATGPTGLVRHGRARPGRGGASAHCSGASVAGGSSSLVGDAAPLGSGFSPERRRHGRGRSEGWPCRGRAPRGALLLEDRMLPGPVLGEVVPVSLGRIGGDFGTVGFEQLKKLFER